ncbi:MAG: hypothetical protein ACLQUY_10620 [Ktedonobacterales bacterium]
MPRDTLGIPAARDAAFRADEAHVPNTLDAGLALENMLLEEFNYAGVTAYQAMEDRARMFNLYLLLVGILASGLGAVFQLGSGVRQYLLPVAVLLLLLIGGLGYVFFLKLIRLRQAHRESLIAMGKIKTFYIDQFKPQLPKIENAFHWRLETIPPGEKFGNVTFLVCYTTAVLGCLCFAIAAFLLFPVTIGQVLDPLAPQFAGLFPYVAALLVWGLLLLLHINIYRRAFDKSRNKAQLAEEVKETAQATQQS